MTAGCMTAGPADAILVAEDEPLVALLVESTLRSGGFPTLGPAGTVAAVLEGLRRARARGADLDSTLRGGLVFPLADALAEAQVPLLFLSGNSEYLLPPVHRQRRILGKPFRRESLLQALRALLAGTAAAP